jgi:hypothetical protein
MDYSLLFTVEANPHYRVGSAVGSKTLSTNSGEEDNHQIACMNLFLIKLI